MLIEVRNQRCGNCRDRRQIVILFRKCGKRRREKTAEQLACNVVAGIIRMNNVIVDRFPPQLARLQLGPDGIAKADHR